MPMLEDRDYESILTPKQCEALYLQIQGLTYREIADELGISPEAVNGRLKRARHHINGTSPKKDKSRRPLTPREIEVLELRRQGMKRKEIAKKLNISLSRVRNHISEINKKQTFNQ